MNKILKWSSMILIFMQIPILIFTVFTDYIPTERSIMLDQFTLMITFVWMFFYFRVKEKEDKSLISGTIAKEMSDGQYIIVKLKDGRTVAVIVDENNKLRGEVMEDK